MGKINQKLGVNPSIVRIREFEMNGQKFRVRIPLTTEAEAIHERVSKPQESLIQQKYDALAKPMLEKKSELEKADGIEFKDNDIIVSGNSLRELAENQAKTESRILETFKLLVPADGGTLDDLTYDDIQEDFPLPIQIDIMRRITEVISPSYEDNRKN